MWIWENTFPDKHTVSHQRLYHSYPGCITELGLIKLSLYPVCNADVIMFSPCLVSPQTAVRCIQRKLQISTETPKAKFSQMQKQYCRTSEWSRSWMSSMDNHYTPLLLAAFVNLSWKTNKGTGYCQYSSEESFFIHTQTTWHKIQQWDKSLWETCLKDRSNPCSAERID